MLTASMVTRIWDHMHGVATSRGDSRLGFATFVAAVAESVGIVNDCEFPCGAAEACGVGHATVVEGCVRCGGKHKVFFVPLKNQGAAHSHWGWCPVTDEPIMMRKLEPGDTYPSSRRN